MNLRIGQGYDVHRFEADRKLILGGVTIPHTLGLLGHSDADVLLHALMDALLGAAGLGDIGVWFPPSDPTLEGISSRKLLVRVRELLTEKQWLIGNVDMTLLAETPKISPYVADMKNNIAADLEIATSDIGIKATTNESMGFIGRREGIAALAVTLLYKKG